MHFRQDIGAAASVYKANVKKQRMTTIWSLRRHAELTVRIYYAVESERVLRLERIERFETAR
jgi:hypothetical protein